MKLIAKPIIISVCTDCESTVVDAVDMAYVAGMRQAVQAARNENAYWAKELERILFGPDIE